MAGITSAFPTSTKGELLSAGHCFLAPASLTGTTTNGGFTVTAISPNTTGLAVGMFLVDTGHSGIPSGAIIASIDSSSQVTMSKAGTAANTGTAITATADSFNIMLFVATASIAGTYGAATTNYSGVTSGDEVTGAGYSAGGQLLVNVSPQTSGTVGFCQFANPTWTSASFTTSGAMIYNTSKRLGYTGAAVGLYNFGGDNTVSSGVFTLIMPSNTSSTSLIRLQ